MKKILSISFSIILIVAFSLPTCAMANSSSELWSMSIGKVNAFTFAELFTKRTIEYSELHTLELCSVSDYINSFLYSPARPWFTCSAGDILVDDDLKVELWDGMLFKVEDSEEEMLVDLYRAAIAMSCLEYNERSESMYDLYEKTFISGDSVCFLDYCVNKFSEAMLPAFQVDAIDEMRAGNEFVFYSGTYSYSITFHEDERIGIFYMIHAKHNSEEK